mmetsp:Transcript_4472/g.13238  ORF Transcript_4472/g.13238 Transcript_4472/m.13238 type:complete len:494 (-) Transcript_4472:188-1669(-)
MVLKSILGNVFDRKGQDQVPSQPFHPEKSASVNPEGPRYLPAQEIHDFEGANVAAEGNLVRVSVLAWRLQSKGRALLRQKPEHALQPNFLQAAKVPGAEEVQVPTRFLVGRGHQELNLVPELAVVDLLVSEDLHHLVPRVKAVKGHCGDEVQQSVHALRFVAFPRRDAAVPVGAQDVLTLEVHRQDVLEGAVLPRQNRRPDRNPVVDVEGDQGVLQHDVEQVFHHAKLAPHELAVGSRDLVLDQLDLLLLALVDEHDVHEALIVRHAEARIVQVAPHHVGELLLGVQAGLPHRLPLEVVPDDDLALLVQGDEEPGVRAAPADAPDGAPPLAVPRGRLLPMPRPVVGVQHVQHLTLVEYPRHQGAVGVPARDHHLPRLAVVPPQLRLGARHEGYRGLRRVSTGEAVGHFHALPLDHVQRRCHSENAERAEAIEGGRIVRNRGARNRPKGLLRLHRDKTQKRRRRPPTHSSSSPLSFSRSPCRSLRAGGQRITPR